MVLNDHSATIVLNRANQLNAFNTQMLRELSEAMDTVAANVDVKALVIESASPKAFSTGLDLSQLESFQSVHEARDFAILLEETMLKVFNFPCRQLPGLTVMFTVADWVWPSPAIFG